MLPRESMRDAFDEVLKHLSETDQKFGHYTGKQMAAYIAARDRRAVKHLSVGFTEFQNGEFELFIQNSVGEEWFCAGKNINDPMFSKLSTVLESCLIQSAAPLTTAVHRAVR